MGTKSFFTKQKSQQANIRGQERSTIQGVSSSIESVEYIKERIEDQLDFLPELDFSEPSNFVKYGSAKDYYVDLVNRVTASYPYDGSLTERLKFENDLVGIQKYELENNYPRSTGYADFSDSNYSDSVNRFSVGTDFTFGLGDSSTNHYIITDNYSKDLIYNTTSSQVGSVELDFAGGVTLEFWMKKEKFPDPEQTQNEVIFSISNAADDLFQVTTDVTGSGSLVACFALQSTESEFLYEFNTGLSTIVDSSWHHYAMVFSTNSAGYVGEMYVDGYFSERQFYTNGSPYLALTGTLDATVAASSLGDYLGDGKLSGALDEVRLWKTARDAKQIGENYFFDVGGGGNTDDAKVNKYNPLGLSLYYKFNEGTTGVTETDSVVLDYSGRLTDGVWIGYTSGSSRSTGSAITESGISQEKGNPVVYSTHPSVIAYKSEKEVSGSNYDAENNNSLYDMLPQWISDEDSQNGLVIRKLIQIMASYLDTLHAQITAISQLQDGTYVSGSSAKPNPFSKRNLISYGFDLPDVFIDPGVIEEIYFKDEKRLYEDKLFNLKNLIFQNIFNNLNYINKSKGTEKSFRNLFRSFGVDNELVRLNMYADNQEYEFKENYETSQAKRNVIDLSGYNDSQSRNGVVYQFADATKDGDETGDYGYLPTASNIYLPLTIENQIHFPKYVDFPGGHLDSRLNRASLFGMHSASIDEPANTAFPADDIYIKVYADTNTNNKTQFVLTSNITSVGTLTSSFYEGVYDNNSWTFAVRVKPKEYPFAGAVNQVTSSNSFDFEFYGVNYNSGIKIHEFSASAEISTSSAPSDISSFLTGSSKRLYIGADRTNITGALNYYSNVKPVSSRVWFDYIKNEELQNHARDVNIFGRKNPYNNAFIYEGDLSTNYIPKIETLGLHWNFENVTGSDSSGEFVVQDTTSGSSILVDNRYPVDEYYNISGRNYSGKGSGFSADSTNVVDFLFVDTAEQQLPENLYSSDLVEIRSQDDILFTRESRPSKYSFAVEMSLYDTISRNILGFFSSVEDFNNLIGEPVNMYRPNYKNLEKLRELFFENIENDPDLEKYINIYKWLDGALDGVISNLIPASAKVSDKVRSVVESHLLERSKYRHKYLHVKEISKEKRIVGQLDEGERGGGKGSGGQRDLGPRWGLDISEDDLPVVRPGAVIGGPIRNPTDYSYLVPEEIRKGKNIIDTSGLRPTRPNGSDPIPVKTSDIRSSQNLDRSNTSDRPLWWRLQAERNPDSILSTGDDGVDKTRVITQINQAQILSASTQSPLSLNVVGARGAGTNVGFAGENRKNYFPNSFKHGPDVAFTADGINISIRNDKVNNSDQPYYDYSGALDQTYDDKRLVPTDILDAGNSINLADKKYIPFDLLSASTAVSNYQSILISSDIPASVETAHRDYVVEGSTLQGPFTKTHVGGWMYRNDNIPVVEQDVTVRKEGYQFNIQGEEIFINNPRILAAATDTWSPTRPLGNYLRDTAVKRSVNIQNISGSQHVYRIGNYDFDYQIIQTTGRQENNRYFVDSEGATGTIDMSTEKLAYDPDGTYVYKDFEILDRENTGSNKFIIVNRFSAPGGVEVSAFSYLDIEAAEYSVYNSLNYRNQTVRFANNKLLTRHTLSGGYDSVLLQPTASYYKPQRNGVYKISASLTSPEPVFDNSYVNFNIPRTDVQYSWIEASWVYKKTGYPNGDTIENGLLTASYYGGYDLTNISSSEYSPIYGFEYSTGSNLQIITSSDQPADPGTEVYVRFNGSNNNFAGDIDLDNNLFTTASGKTSGDYFFLPEFSDSTAFAVLNGFLLNNNGPYQHPSFKQIRGADHRVARAIRNKNLYKTQLDIFSEDRNRLERAGKTYFITQSAVTSKFKTILQNIDPATGTIEYSFGNLYDYFAKTYNTTKNEVEDLNRELGAPSNDIYDSDFYKFSQKYNTIIYNETIYPREENEYRDLARNRENYVSFWKSDTLGERTDATIVNSQGYTINASQWLVDVSTSGSGELETSGELMRFTGSVGFTSSMEGERNARYSFNLGECRPYNQVQSQAGIAAFYTSYGAFSTDTRLIGQDETIIPEFTISDYVSTIVQDYRGDFTEKSVYAFELTGSKTMESASFLETYSRTEKLTYLKELKDFYGEPTAIKFTFTATKKLLPKEGFYPVQRTVQLAGQLSSSYSGSYIVDSVADQVLENTVAPIGTQASQETTLMPFWAPGIGYNSIKAGFAVEFPYKTDATMAATASITTRFDSTAPFEAILTPSEYVGAIHHISNSGSATPWIEPELDSTGSVNRTDGVYELMSHNFFGEVPEFFLDDLSFFKSAPQERWEFEGPFDIGGETKKFALDVVIENPGRFIQYGAPQAYGPFPQNHHAPPGMYYGFGSQPPCPAWNNVHGPNGERGANTTATLVFDPSELISTTSRKGQTTFTLADIVANSTIQHAHSNGQSVFMSNTASLDLFNLDEEGHWVIKSKWECPVLNFAQTVATGGGAPANQPHTYTRGMWHQYGSLIDSGPRTRLHVRLQETSYADPSLTGSLLSAVSFPIEAKSFGRIKNNKIIEEAVCAVPFYVDCETGEEKFFEIPINIFENRYSQVRRGDVTDDSISDMIRKMDKYVVPPPYDFVNTRDNSRKILTLKAEFEPVRAPFSMYFFEFSNTLNQEDLAKVWQGVMPRIVVEAEKETVILEHPIVDGELLSPSIFRYNKLAQIPNDIRWKMFKVKKRAQYDYYKMVQKQTGVPTYKRAPVDRFSFNWPYDYFSLVELGKMEVGFEVRNDNPDRIRSIQGGGYITPEDVIQKSIDLGTPLTVYKEPAPAAAAVERPKCTEEDARELQLLVNKSQTQTSALAATIGGSLTSRESNKLQLLLAKCPRPKSATPTLPLIDIGLLSDLTIPEREPEARLCDDRTALNYNGPAPCRYEAADRLVDVPGCNDPTALNYDPGATINDGSCEYFTCNDEVASNFGQKGECKYEVVRGCMDPDAVNYNPNATEDDPSQCLYEGADGLPQGNSPDDAGMGNESVF